MAPETDSEPILFEPARSARNVFRALEAASATTVARPAELRREPSSRVVQLQKQLTADSLQATLAQMASTQVDCCDWSHNASFIALGREAQIQTLAGLAHTGDALTTVMLCGLALSDACAPAIGALLQSRHPLQKLQLTDNDLREHGLLHIAKAVEGHPTLEELSVEGQKHDLSGAHAAHSPSPLSRSHPQPLPSRTSVYVCGSRLGARYVRRHGFDAIAQVSTTWQGSRRHGPNPLREATVDGI